MESGLDENVEELAHWFFSTYPNLNIAKGDCGFKIDEWTMDAIVMGL